MIECKVVLNKTNGNYPHSLEGISEEDFQIIKNFLNSAGDYSIASLVGWSASLQGESINDVEWKLLYDNAEILGIEFIVEGHLHEGNTVEEVP